MALDKPALMPITVALVEGTPSMRRQQAVLINRRFEQLEKILSSIVGDLSGETGTDGEDSGDLFGAALPKAVAAVASNGSEPKVSRSDHIHDGVTSLGFSAAVKGILTLLGDLEQDGTNFYFPKHVDWESPSGTINGINTIFTLANTPDPTTSLRIFMMFSGGTGHMLVDSGQYSLVGNTITFTTAPPTGATIRCFYRWYR